MMIVLSVNIGSKRTVRWSGKNYNTGIFKSPVDHIFLDQEDVNGDHVVDRKYHGGVDKACYAFSAGEYAYWEKKYPELEFKGGMFGENLTVVGLDETSLNIGDTFEIGDAIIQVSEPRQPCVKLNIRFNSKQMMKQFISRARCGVYFRVLQSGKVIKDDQLRLIQKGSMGISIQEVFNLLYAQGEKERALALINNEELGSAVRSELDRIWNK